MQRCKYPRIVQLLNADGWYASYLSTEIWNMQRVPTTNGRKYYCRVAFWLLMEDETGRRYIDCTDTTDDCKGQNRCSEAPFFRGFVYKDDLPGAIGGNEHETS